MSRRSGVILAVLSLSAAILACGGDDAAAPRTPLAAADAGHDGSPTAEDAAPVLLPTGAIVFPTVDVWTPDARGRVLGTATPPSSRTIVQVTLNGRPATTNDGYAHWTADVDLAPGPNPLVLRVIDSTGATSTTTGVSVASSSAMRNGVTTEAVLVKDGLVYAGDGSEIVSFPTGGGPRTTLAKLDVTTDGFHLFALDGSTLYFVTRNGKFGSVPLAGGAVTTVGNVFTNQRAAAAAGGKLVLMSRQMALGGGGASGLASYPVTGGDPTLLPLSYGTPLDFQVLDYDLANGSFYVTLANHKPLIVPVAGGTVTDLDISRNTGGGDEYPALLKVSGDKIYVSFDPTGATWFTTGLTGGALAPSGLVLPVDATTSTRYAIDGDACYLPAFFGGVERVPLTGGPAKYLTDNDIVDHAFFGTADAADIFITTPKGVTAYSRTTFQKRELYTWPTFDGNFGYRSVAATAGDKLFVAQGKTVTVITKSTGAGKVLVPSLKADAVAKAIAADEKTLYVRNGDIELYDASTGSYSQTNVFPPPSANYSSALAVDATSLYASTINGDLVKTQTTGDFFVVEPFGTPAISAPTSLVLGADALWVLDDQRTLFRVPVATGASTKVLDGATVGFTSLGKQYLLAVDDTKLVVSINGLLSRVMITNVDAGASYFLR